ncbi:MAG TPA: formimidoylglutamate deiminase [Planctomycetota bacterium]
MILEADWTWTGTRFESGVRVQVGPDGRIAALGALAEPPSERLPGQALLPGFLNAHSHAFQRGLRGRGERFPQGAGSFWSWREAMYGLVGELDAARLRALATQAFREMLAAGITTVGEFHYLHHAKEGDWELDEAVLEAARESGIRLVLLQAYYRTGAIGQPLAGAQRRFDARSFEEFWRHADALVRRLDPARETLGIAPHSVRALALEELERVHREARARSMVVHMHLEETRQEIEDCRAAHGRTPMELVAARLDLDAGFTAVHGTHTGPDQLAFFLNSGANLCLCPLTEANLGDGTPALGRVPRDGLCLGTDSNARISMLEEMRWAEYAQRLAREERGCLVDGEGQVARRLLAAATVGGARALGVRAGALEVGAWADLVAWDLTAPALAGWTPETLLESLVLGADERARAATWVGGRRVA